MFENDEDTVTLKINRSQLMAVALPLVFLLGLALGYGIWGRAPEIVAEEIPLEIVQGSTSSEDTVSQSGDQISVSPPTVADQIAGLDRYDFSLGEFDPATGPENALITIVEFSDFECPFCQRHFQEVYPRLQSQYPDQIRYVYMDFPLTSIHPNSLLAAEAGQCALEQDSFWPFHDLLFGATLGLNQDSFETYASTLGMDLDAFILCLESGRYSDEVQADLQLGIDTGVNSTPTFFINGVGLVGAQPFEVFAQIIDYELERLAAE